jgi:hypothetical protein
VKALQQALRAERALAVDAYEGATPYRNHLLWLLNAVVGLYIAISVYLICLYGACGADGVVTALPLCAWPWHTSIPRRTVGATVADGGGVGIVVWWDVHLLLGRCTPPATAAAVCARVQAQSTHSGYPSPSLDRLNPPEGTFARGRTLM